MEQQLQAERQEREMKAQALAARREQRRREQEKQQIEAYLRHLVRVGVFDWYRNVWLVLW